MSEYWQQFLDTEEDDTELKAPEDDTTGDLIPGNESLDTHTNPKAISVPFFAEDNGSTKTTLCGGNGGDNEVPLLIRTSDQKNYRIYIREEMGFSQNYLNKLCFFLDSREPQQSVTIIFGAKIQDEQAHMLGGVLASIKNCKAKVVGVCAGYCSISETLLWCFCPTRIMYRYGALSFGITDAVSSIPSYQFYFDLFLQRSVELGIITEEEKQQLKDTGGELMLLYSDYNARMNARQVSESNTTELNEENNTTTTEQSPSLYVSLGLESFDY